MRAVVAFDSDPLEFRTAQQRIESTRPPRRDSGGPSVRYLRGPLNRFLYGVSHSYDVFGFASIYEHVRLEKELRRRVDVRLEQHDGGLRLIVGSVGRRPQVSVVCGVLAHFGVTLQRGRFISRAGSSRSTSSSCRTTKASSGAWSAPRWSCAA